MTLHVTRRVKNGHGIERSRGRKYNNYIHSLWTVIHAFKLSKCDVLGAVQRTLRPFYNPSTVLCWFVLFCASTLKCTSSLTTLFGNGWKPLAHVQAEFNLSCNHKRTSRHRFSVACWSSFRLKLYETAQKRRRRSQWNRQTTTNNLRSL